MLVEDIKLLTDDFDEMVELKFKSFLSSFLRGYRDNPTKQKFFHLIMNMPIGFILKSSELDGLITDGKIPKYNELIAVLKDKKKLISLIKDIHDPGLPSRM
jgi:predicted acetyltransferase